MKKNPLCCCLSALVGMWLALCLAENVQGQVIAVESGRDGAVIRVERQQEQLRKSNTQYVPVVHQSGSDLVAEKSGVHVFIQEQTVEKPSFVHELPRPSLAGKNEPVVTAVARAIAYGWQEYNQGNYEKSRQLFRQGVQSSTGEMQWDARTGLAFSLVQLGDTDKALPLLRELLEHGWQLESVAPTLAGLLLERGDLAELQDVLQTLPVDQASRWRQKIAAARFQQQVQTLLKRGDVAGLIRLIDSRRDLLAGCRCWESFFQAARFLSNRNEVSASRLLGELGRCAPSDIYWQERILRLQLSMESNSELIARIAATPPSGLPASSWKKLLRQIFWQRITLQKSKGEEYEQLVKALYTLAPEDDQVASLAAWICFQEADYGCAENIFTRLVNGHPSNDSLLGLAYTLQKMGDETTALELTERFSKSQDPGLKTLRYDLLASLGTRYYQEEQYGQAAQYLQQALALQPDNLENRKLLLWCGYQEGDVRPLAEFLLQQYQQQPTATKAEELAGILGRLKDPAYSRRVMAGFAASALPAVRKLAGDYFFQHYHPVLAAQTYQGESPYAGCAAPVLDTMVHLRSKDGDQGLSKLTSSSLLVRQQVSTTGGRTWSISIAPLFIDSGSVPADLPVGSSFLRKQGNEGRPELWEDNLVSWQWQAGVRIEGDVDWDLRLGTTPLDGIVAPAVVGGVQAAGEDWQLEATREPVRESLLSWVGQTDPYTGREWGRVVTTRLSGAKTLSFADWWLSLEGSYALYRGEHVEQNSSLTAALSGGITSDWQEFERSAGLFVFARSFTKNSNFYTFGHGGYYSPARQLISGPFVRVTTKPESRYWLDVSLSVGLNYTDTDDAARYVELGSLDPNLSEAARLDPAGRYSGESDLGIGLDARVRGLVPLSGGWFVGGEAGVNNAADFTLWQVAFLLRYRFGEGRGLGVPEQRFSTLTDLVH